MYGFSYHNLGKWNYQDVVDNYIVILVLTSSNESLPPHWFCAPYGIVPLWLCGITIQYKYVYQSLILISYCCVVHCTYFNTYYLNNMHDAYWQTSHNFILLIFIYSVTLYNPRIVPQNRLIIVQWINTDNEYDRDGHAKDRVKVRYVIYSTNAVVNTTHWSINI